MNTKEYWLVSTEHLEDRLWFRDEEDFKAAMNFVAVLSCVLGVDILAFVLMSNHVHFVIRGSRKKVLEYVNEFKRRYSIYIGHRYGVKEFPAATTFIFSSSKGKRPWRGPLPMCR